jgi:hypothetical protein
MFPDQYTCDLVSHVPGSRRRERIAEVAQGPWTRSQRRRYAERIRHGVKPFVVGSLRSPSSPLWGASSWRSSGPERGEPGPKVVAERSHFGDWEVPKCIASTATLRLIEIFP